MGGKKGFEKYGKSRNLGNNSTNSEKLSSNTQPLDKKESSPIKFVLYDVGDVNIYILLHNSTTNTVTYNNISYKT